MTRVDISPKSVRFNALNSHTRIGTFKELVRYLVKIGITTDSQFRSYNNNRTQGRIERFGSIYYERIV